MLKLGLSVQMLTSDGEGPWIRSAEHSHTLQLQQRMLSTSEKSGLEHSQVLPWKFNDFPRVLHRDERRDQRRDPNLLYQVMCFSH